MYQLKLLVFFACLTIGLGQFSLSSVPRSSRNPNKQPRINAPNTIIRIQVGPKVTVTNESISSLSTGSSVSVVSTPSSVETAPSSVETASSSVETASSSVEPLNLKKRSTLATSLNNQSDSDKANESTELATPDVSSRSPNPNEATTSNRTPKFGFGSFGHLKPKFPNVSGGLSSFKDKLKPMSNEDGEKPVFPSIDGLKPNIPGATEFGKFANDTANKFKDIPIVSKFLNIPSYFKVNSLKGALDYMTKYGHLENPIDIEKPEDLFNLKDAFLKFQNFFGLSTTGLFDQQTLELMNKPRRGLPDKETRFTKLFNKVRNDVGLIRRKRFEVHSAKYEQRNLTWSINEFSKNALKGQDDKVLEVMRKAFQVWADKTNLNFEYKERTNTTDIVIGFYTKVHGNPRIEPPFDGPNGTLAHTSYPTIWDLHFDDDENFVFYPDDHNSENHTDLFTVSIHEIGHKLGLKHTSVKSACLFPIYNPKSTKLDPDDIQGIQTLYGVKHNPNEKEKEIVDASATEKPEEDKDKEHDDSFEPTPNDKDGNQPNNRPGPSDNRPSEGNTPDENRPDRPTDENRPDNIPDGGRPDGPFDGNRPDRPGRPNRPHRPHHDNRPDGPFDNNRPGYVPEPDESTNKPIRILEYNPRRNIESRREFNEISSIPCHQLEIGASACLRNDKCLVISGDEHFWMNGRLKMIKRRRERNDVLFKGLTGKIDALYRDNDLIHIIQGRNVTTYDAFYSEPVNRTTLDQHFPGLPKHVRRIDSVFKKLSTGVIYIYSGELYYRYTKAYGLEQYPRLTFIWGLPGKVSTVLHFNNGKSVYIKNKNYWVFDESSNQLLSYAPGNLADFNICRNENFNIFG